MSSRTPGESMVRSRNVSHSTLATKKFIRNENVNQTTRPSAQKPMGSSAKPPAVEPSSKSVLKPKSSRPVLASLTNATPRPKALTGGKGLESQKPLQTLKTSSATATAHAQTPARRPAKTPKSTKKAINIYTPGPVRAGAGAAAGAGAGKGSHHEVEFTHPASPPLLDGPPSPLRTFMEGVDDFGPVTHTKDMIGLDFEPPSAAESGPLDPLQSPSRTTLTSDFDFDHDQNDPYSF